MAAQRSEPDGDGRTEGSHITCRIITSRETWPLRHEVLRPGRPLDTCRWEGDDLPTTRHFAAIEADRIVAIGSLYARSHEVAPEPGAWQLRGMAVAPARQGQGLGGLILHHMVSYCRTVLGGRCVWCNARVKAVPFYVLHGFSTVGDEFNIAGIGPHLVMLRTL